MVTVGHDLHLALEAVSVDGREATYDLLCETLSAGTSQKPELRGIRIIHYVRLWWEEFAKDTHGGLFGQGKAPVRLQQKGPARKEPRMPCWRPGLFSAAGQER
jgi:hypothetical protein